VQMQYQIQRNLGDWVVYAPNAAAPPLNGAAVTNGGIQATPLPSPGAPGAPPSAPATAPVAPGAPLPLGSRTLGTLPVTPGVSQ